MVLPEGAATLVSAAQHLDDMSRVNRPLVEAIAKAHRWQAQLESGEYASLEDLAKDVGCDRTYVGRILHLTSLAPDIVEAILRGEEPDGISLEKLRKNLPVRWEEQRERWQNEEAFSCEPRAGKAHRRPTETDPSSLACSSTATPGYAHCTTEQIAQRDILMPTFC